MQLRVVTILCAAVTAVELGIVVVRWTACSTPAPAPPTIDASVVHFAPPDAGPAAPSNRPFAELVEATFDRQFVKGTATVPAGWPDGFAPVLARTYAFDGAVHVATARGPIELSDVSFERELTLELTIRAGNRLVIDYDAPSAQPPWKGQLECALPAAGEVLLAPMRSDPPLSDVELVETVRELGELRSHWRGTPPGGRDNAHGPLCVFDVAETVAVDEHLHIPMPPVKGQYISLPRHGDALRVRINDSMPIACWGGGPHVVAFDHVPDSSRIGTDDQNNWIITRIADSAFGVTCTGSGSMIIPVKVGAGTTDLKCTLSNDTLKCPGK